MWESRLVSESITHHPNMTSPLGDSLCLAPTVILVRHTKNVKSTEPNTEPLNTRGWQTSAQISRKLQVMVHCHAAVCTIYPVWQLPALYPVIAEACTLVFHLWPLPLCTLGISSPPWYDDSVSLASPHVSRIPGGTLHGQEDESWQHNAVVKDDGWAGGLTECSAALKRWMFSRPDMACYHYLLWKMSRSRIVQECRRYSSKMWCQYLLLANMAIHFSKPVATFSFWTHGTL